MKMEDYRTTLNTVGWILASFSTLFVAARLYTRTRISTTQLGLDDWFMLIAWVCGTPETYLSALIKAFCVKI